MKGLFLFLIICIAQLCYGQKPDVIAGGNYYFDYLSKTELDSISVDEIESKNFDLVKAKSFLSGKQYKVTIKKVVDQKVFFTFWKFKDSISNRTVNGTAADIGTQANSRVTYTMPLNTFQDSAKPIFNKVIWKAGVYTVPFKLRFDDFSFDSNINLGINIGAKWRFNRKVENGSAIEPVFGFGLSSIKLDESNSLAVESTNLSAFTFNFGTVMHVTNAINLGIFVGRDYLFDKDQIRYQWKHNGKHWLGLGINVAFGNSSDNTGQGKN